MYSPTVIETAVGHHEIVEGDRQGLHREQLFGALGG